MSPGKRVDDVGPLATQRAVTRQINLLLANNTPALTNAYRGYWDSLTMYMRAVLAEFDHGIQL